MDFTPTEERRLLSDSLDKLLAEACGFAARNAAAYAPPFHDPALWERLSELGLFYAFVPEASGGIGGAGFDLMSVFEPLGRALCPEPVLPQMMGLRLLARAGAECSAALGGTERLAVALFEPHAPYDLTQISAEATQSGASWQIEGRKSVVYGAPSATRLLIAARHVGGLGLFSVVPDQVTLTPYAMVDGGGAAEVILSNTPAELILAEAEPALLAALEAGRLALCAEAVGVAEVCLKTTVDYLKTRQQFGKPLAAFQALQHRAVDLAIELEQMRSITIRAAADLDTPAAARSVALAKELIGRAGQQIAEESIQLHGGIAMTWEYPLSHYAKRLVMIDAQLGDRDWQLDRLAF